MQVYATLAVLLACERVAGTALSAPSFSRLRGGEGAEDAAALGLKAKQMTGRMSTDEVIEKLNSVPAFCILLGDGSVISLPDPKGADGEACTWFLDPHEAAATFRRCKAANPGESMRLASQGLGDVLQSMGALPTEDANAADAAAYDGTLKLAPHKAFAEPIFDQLVASVRQENMEAGAWAVPTFVGEELAQAGSDGEQRALPIFMSPYDLRDAYEKVGVLSGKVAQTGPRVMELRVLAKHMLAEPKEYPNPWRAVQFVPTRPAVELARKLYEQSQDA